MSKSNTKTTEVVEAEVKTEPKPRVSRLERARLALAAAEAKEAEKRAKKLDAVLARRAATMASLASNHDKLAGIDNELIQLVGADAYAELSLPGPVCDTWSDENSYVTLAGGRMVTIAEVKKSYELQHGLAERAGRTWPAYLEHEGEVHLFSTAAAFQLAVEQNLPAALYGKDVTGDVTEDTSLAGVWGDVIDGAADEVASDEVAAEAVPV